jgi:hypothetical protein
MSEPANTLPPGRPPNFKFPAKPDAYLGNPEVVDAVVRGFVSNAARAVNQDQCTSAVNRWADIFCGNNND